MPEPHRPDRPRPSRRTVALIVAPLILLVIATNVGGTLAPTLVDKHPLVLMMLNARNRNLILVTNLIDPVPYYAVGAARLLVSDPLFFLLGYFYGDAAVRWMERRAPSVGGLMRSVEQFFGKAAYPLVFLAPNNYICLFAGAAGMRLGVFAALNVSGTFVRLYLIRLLGETFEKPIDAVLDFIKDYRIPLLVLSVALVAFTVWREARRTGESEIGALAHLDEELEHEEQEDSE